MVTPVAKKEKGRPKLRKRDLWWIFSTKLEASDDANDHGRMRKKERKRICALYLGSRRLLDLIFGKHDEREVGSNFNKLR